MAVKVGDIVEIRHDDGTVTKGLVTHIVTGTSKADHGYIDIDVIDSTEKWMKPGDRESYVEWKHEKWIKTIS